LRYINLSKIIFPNGWIKKAKEAKVESENDIKKINIRSNVWSDIKAQLEKLSFNKCWYCECEQIRSDNAVDHFRPKGRVANTKPKHTGYTWLAFDYNNYRYACTYCNSKRKNSETNEIEGKGDEFPLIDESKRAYKESDNIKLEKPILLDPCNINDVKLLDFTFEGKPCPKKNLTGIKKERVEKSIKLYHLDNSELNRKRNDLAIKIKEKVYELNEFLDEYPDIDPSVSLQNDLQKFMNPEESELSVFARKIIMSYREYEWIDDLICTA